MTDYQVAGSRIDSKMLGEYTVREQEQILAVMKMRAARMRNGEIAKNLHISETMVRTFYQAGLEAYRGEFAVASHSAMMDVVLSFENIANEGWRHIAQNGYGKNPGGVAALLGRIIDAEWKRAQIIGIVTEGVGKRYQEMTDDELRSEADALSRQLNGETLQLAEHAVEDATGAVEDRVGHESDPDRDSTPTPPIGDGPQTDAHASSPTVSTNVAGFHPENLSGLQTRSTPSSPGGQTGEDQ